MSEIEKLCKITNFLSALFFVFTEITKVGWSKKVLLGPLRPGQSLFINKRLALNEMF